MAIYKKPSTASTASTRQSIFWAIWGALAGIYVFYPMLRATHRHEKSYLADWITESGNVVQMKKSDENEEPEVLHSTK